MTKGFFLCYTADPIFLSISDSRERARSSRSTSICSWKVSRLRSRESTRSHLNLDTIVDVVLCPEALHRVAILLEGNAVTRTWVVGLEWSLGIGARVAAGLLLQTLEVEDETTAENLGEDESKEAYMTWWEVNQELRKWNLTVDVLQVGIAFETSAGWMTQGLDEAYLWNMNAAWWSLSDNILLSGKFSDVHSRH